MGEPSRRSTLRPSRTASFIRAFRSCLRRRAPRWSNAITRGIPTQPCLLTLVFAPVQYAGRSELDKALAAAQESAAIYKDWPSDIQVFANVYRALGDQDVAGPAGVAG